MRREKLDWTGPDRTCGLLFLPLLYDSNKEKKRQEELNGFEG